MRTASEQVVDYPSSLHWSETFDFSAHDLTSHNFVPLRHRRHFSLHEWNVFQMNVNIIKTFIKDVSSKASCHECQHEWKHILHIASSLEENDCQGNCHSSHATKDSCSTHQRVGTTISKGTIRVIQFVQQMSTKATKCSSRKQRWYKQSTWDRDTIRNGCQCNVRKKKKKERSRRKGTGIVCSRFSKVKELLYCGIRIRQNQTGHFIVLFSRNTSKRNEIIYQVLFLIRPILHIGRKFCTSIP
mmetsp:Transcript_31918/g.57742  ORF Transcript_31918/g.57742 Transcript_31918/m.57742 type:complete len:243 (+) Transcript_31918:731-1459(+)